MYVTVLFQIFKIGLHMQCQCKQCLMDIQSETQPNCLRQITMQKEKSINSVWWSATCGQ